MNRISIGGRIFESISNVQIFKDTLTVNGQRVEGTLSGVVEIRVLDGKIENLSCDASVNCGAVEGDVRAGGSVNADSVGGNVHAGGSVHCDAVGGNVAAGGSVNCDDIGGSVTASIVKRG